MKFLNKSLAFLLALTLSFPSYAAVPTVMSDLSTTAASNSPAGTEAPTSIDDFLRAIQSIVRHTNAKGADIASAATTNIGAATGEFIDVTGTTTITGLGTIAAGIERTVRFTGALTLTHNATSLILPGAANITTAANHVAVFRSLGSGNWLCVSYFKADGTPIVAPAAAPFIDSTAIIKGSADATKLIRMEADGITTGTTRVITMPDKDVNLGSASKTAEGLVELATTAEIKTGTDTTRAIPVDQLLAALGFSAYFQSTAQTITAGGALTIAHGLGRKPILAQFYLVNTTGELGYSIGDEVYIGNAHSSTTADNYGLSYTPDATNINIRYGSNANVFRLINKTTGAGIAITAANWTLVVRVWG
jgi:hypothetical protein